VVYYIRLIHRKTNIELTKLISLLGITSSKYYSWINRTGKTNNHNGKIPKKNWILKTEKQAIIKYAKAHENEGYRRLTYMR
jgi:hypothetical protein